MMKARGLKESSQRRHKRYRYKPHSEITAPELLIAIIQKYLLLGQHGELGRFMKTQGLSQKIPHVAIDATASAPMGCSNSMNLQAKLSPLARTIFNNAEALRSIAFLVASASQYLRLNFTLPGWVTS